MNIKRIYFNKLIQGELYHIRERIGGKRRPYEMYINICIYLYSWGRFTNGSQYHTFYDIKNKKKVDIKNGNYFRYRVFKITQ